MSICPKSCYVHNTDDIGLSTYNLQISIQKLNHWRFPVLFQSCVSWCVFAFGSTNIICYRVLCKVWEAAALHPHISPPPLQQPSSQLHPWICKYQWNIGQTECVWVEMPWERVHVLNLHGPNVLTIKGGENLPQAHFSPWMLLKMAEARGDEVSFV